MLSYVDFTVNYVARSVGWMEHELRVSARNCVEAAKIQLNWGFGPSAKSRRGEVFGEMSFCMPLLPKREVS